MLGSPLPHPLLRFRPPCSGVACAEGRRRCPAGSAGCILAEMFHSLCVTAQVRNTLPISPRPCPGSLSRVRSLKEPMYPAVADSRTRRHHPFFRPTQTLAVTNPLTRRAPRPARHRPHPVTRLRSCSVRSAVRSSRAVRRTLWTRSGGWRRWTWRRWSARCRTRAISSTSASTPPPPLPSGPCVVVALGHSVLPRRHCACRLHRQIVGNSTLTSRTD